MKRVVRTNAQGSIQANKTNVGQSARPKLNRCVKGDHRLSILSATEIKNWKPYPLPSTPDGLTALERTRQRMQGARICGQRASKRAVRELAWVT